MAQTSCPECKAMISDAAGACPQCGKPQQAASTPPAKGGGGRRLAALVLLLGSVAVLAYLYAPRESKDSLNRVLSNTGVTITPWTDRAEAAIRAMLEKPDQRETIAKSVIATTNPSGTKPTLATYQVATAGKTLTTTLEFRWRGGLLGTEYQTIVEWRCNEQGHIQAQVTKENATIGQNEKSKKALDDYFKTGVWPALYSNTGGK